MIKQLFFTLFSFCLIVIQTSCSQQMEEEIFTQTQAESYSTKTRSVSEVVNLATEAFNRFNSSKGRSGDIFSPDQKVKTLTTKSKGRNNETDTLLYIINNSQGDGFVVIAAPRILNPILAVCESGHINDVDNIDNPGMELYVDAASNFIIESLEDADEINPWMRTDTLLVGMPIHQGPYCTVKWGQHYPEGLFSYNSREKCSGCGPTAAVQALSYFNLPDTINLTYPFSGGRSINLDWEYMKTNVKSYSWGEYYNLPPIRNAQLIENERNLGYLCRELGHRMNATYDSIITLTSLEDVKNVIRQLCPTLIVSDRFNGQPLSSNVSNNEIFIMRGGHLVENHELQIYGHIWIIDGHIKETYMYLNYIWNLNTNQYDLLNSQTTTYEYQHINWGWRGDCNGFFNLDVFNCNQAVEYDNPELSNNSTDSYSYSISYFSLKPQNQ